MDGLQTFKPFALRVKVIFFRKCAVLAAIYPHFWR